MNTIKKAVFSALVAGLAFGFSAFTTVKESTTLVYYKTDFTYPNVNDPRGYQYFSGDRCEFGTSVCSSHWDIGMNPLPTEGSSLPLTGVTFQSGSVEIGQFD